jgi:hypothetical protein
MQKGGGDYVQKNRSSQSEAILCALKISPPGIDLAVSLGYLLFNLQKPTWQSLLPKKVSIMKRLNLLLKTTLFFILQIHD